MKKITEFFKNYQLPLLAGFLIGTSYIPLPPWATLFCYVPLWIFWMDSSKTYKQIFWGGFWAQFLLNLIGFHWIIVTAHDFGQLPWPVSLLALLAFAALSHLHIPLVGLSSKFLLNRGYLNSKSYFLGTALLLGLAEYYWPYLFQWHMGYTLLWGQFPAAQFADIIGFHGLSVVLLIFNALFANLIAQKLDRKRFFKRSAGLILTFFFINVLGSFWAYLEKSNYPTETKSLLVVQGNIGNLERVYAERGAGYQDYIASTYFRLTEEALNKSKEQNEKVDLIIWPESAFPEYLDAHYMNSQRAILLKRKVQQWNTPLMTGSYSKDKPEIVNPPKTYNALSLFERNGELNPDSPYQKHHLLAFGEYTPLVQYLPFLESISPAGSGFGRGLGARVLNLEGLAIGPQICYEALYPKHSQELTQKGAEIIINLTNDSWFGDTFEPTQHLYMTLARSIENRIPMVRATNTGITTAMSAFGEIYEQLPRNNEATKLYKISVPVSHSLTLFTQFGHLLPIILVLLIGGIIGISRSQKFRLAGN